ncbi:MAG: serine hydrolase [Raineya sp.]|nr:serine hydrolase [Raineya sp.]
MHRILIFLLLGLFCQKTFAQSIPKEITEKVKNLFNDQKFSELYNLFDENAKKAISEEKFQQTAKELIEKMGKIQEIEYQEGKRYLLKCSLKNYVMFLDTNKENQVSLFFFKPQKSDKVLSNNPLKTDLDKKVDKYLGYIMQNEGTVGASVAVLKGSKTYFYHYGEVKKDSKILPNEKSIYEIGSISKTFTAILACIAEQEGKLRLDDEVSKFLPDTLPKLIFNQKPILIKHLLNHTSGLPRMPMNIFLQKSYEMDNPYRSYSTADLFFFLKNFKPFREPEKTFEYSNLAFGLMGVILERLYQKDYESLLIEKICKPLQMNYTHTRYVSKWQSLMMQGYNEKQEPTKNWDFEAMAAAGAIRSNITDMALYAQSLMKSAPTNLQKAFEKTFITTFKNDEQEIGLSWFKKDSYLWHNGATGGYCSFLAFDRNSQTALVLLLNSNVNFFEQTLAITLMQKLISEK